MSGKERETVKRQPVDNPVETSAEQGKHGTIGAQIKTAPSGGGTPTRSLTTTTDKESMMADASILTLTQRLLLIRSITGHITPATTPEQAQVALVRVEQILNGGDPVAGGRP